MKRKKQSKKPIEKCITMADGIRVKRREKAKFGTAAQVEQQIRFAIATGFTSKVKSALSLRPHQLKYMSAFNYLVKHILQDAIVGKSPDFKIDHRLLMISKGSLVGSWTNWILLRSDGSCTLEWEGTRGDADDLLQVLLYNKQQDNAHFFADVAQRDALKVLIHYPGYKEGDELCAWMYFKSNSLKAVSDSQYIDIEHAD